MTRKKARAKKPPGRLRRVARVLAALLAFVVFVGLGAIALIGWHAQSYFAAPLVEDGRSVTVVIEPGTSWKGVVSVFARQGLVEHEIYMDLWGRYTGVAHEVKAGTFYLDGPVNWSDLDQILRQGGAVDEIQVTILEGWTIFHIADHLESVGLMDRQEFLFSARDPQLMESRGVEGESFEGYLFPDTYRFRKATSAESLIARLHNRFEDIWSQVEEAHQDEMTALMEQYDFGKHQFVTLASLIERETGVSDERALISRVFYNRFDRSMRLQTDPTCSYSEATYREVPNPRLCRDPLNRYSTYVIDGLPPGPIGAPGRQSLLAAVQPSNEPEALEFLYFVARRDGAGRHHFSKTYQEHRQAIRRYLQR